MVGNNQSDLNFGRNAGMKTAFLRTTQPDIELPEGLADIEATDLHDLFGKLRSLWHDC
jgi:phosphoglycolate phosphatase-like HAD superfamily hydrolase